MAAIFVTVMTSFEASVGRRPQCGTAVQLQRPLAVGEAWYHLRKFAGFGWMIACQIWLEYVVAALSAFLWPLSSASDMTQPTLWNSQARVIWMEMAAAKSFRVLVTVVRDSGRTYRLYAATPDSPGAALPGSSA